MVVVAPPPVEAAFITRLSGLKLRGLSMAPAQVEPMVVVVVVAMVDMAAAG
jgi:hypothetical protein